MKLTLMSASSVVLVLKHVLFPLPQQNNFTYPKYITDKTRAVALATAH